MPTTSASSAPAAPVLGAARNPRLYRQTRRPRNRPHHLHARWYDAELGRFITPDWWDPVDAGSAVNGGAAGVKGNPVGMNSYVYAGQEIDWGSVPPRQ